MKIGHFFGYDVHLPTSGGKAGKGKAKTSSFQIRRNNVILKQFHFEMESAEGRKSALAKTKAWIIQEHGKQAAEKLAAKAESEAV